MQISEVVENENVDFTGIDLSYFLIGLLSAFDNRFQAIADKSMREISWKQFFAIICINLCKESPTIKELAEIMGSSHQNVKQILNKLEDKGFVRTISDEKDKRKQRIIITEKTKAFCEEHEEGSQRIVKKIFEGIDTNDIGIAIRTIMQMEENLEEVY